VVGRLADLFAGQSVAAFDRRIRSHLARGDVAEACRLLGKARDRHHGAHTLEELALAVRRAQARDEMRQLDRQIALTGDPHAYERLVLLYDEVRMHEEARRTLKAYAGAHPDLDTPQLMLGEAHLKAFFEDLSARDAHLAEEHLRRAARLNAQALKPRLLLAELYFCVDARRALSIVRDSIQELAHDEQSLEAVVAAMSRVAEPNAEDRTDGLFERIEVEGRLPREPADWPLSTPRHAEARLREERAARIARNAVREGDVQEFVVLRRDGTVLAHAGGDDPPAAGGATASGEEGGLVGIVRAVARTIMAQAREFDLGRFRRCVLEGGFGLVVCGRWGNVLAAARRTSRQDPLHLWERICRRLDAAGVEEVA
jgi:hypothetical protein